MKNRLRTNILIDAGLLVGMAAVSISGFVMNVILPSRCWSPCPCIAAPGHGAARLGNDTYLGGRGIAATVDLARRVPLEND